MVICTQYCPNGTLTSKLDDLSPISCILYFVKIACAVRYLNDRQRIVHSDIKPCNILIDSNDNPVLADFGLSFFILPDEKVVATRGMGGTPPFSAPEICTHSEVDPYKVSELVEILIY
jgi:serine/threonine protein kinase